MKALQTSAGNDLDAPVAARSFRARWNRNPTVFIEKAK
jgi:hypothetical protein